MQNSGLIDSNQFLMKFSRFWRRGQSNQLACTLSARIELEEPPTSVRARDKQLLLGIAVRDEVGAEIGALDSPLVDKGAGRVFYVDHCNTDALKARWASDPNVKVNALHVDAVWGEDTLREALTAAGAFEGERTGLDYVVASHVVEHVPDLVSWLSEVKDVLAPHGHLRLAIPDRRYTFDYLRRTSSLSDVLESFVRRRRTPSGSRILDFALNMALVDCGKAWRGEIIEADLVRGYSDESALSLARDAETNGTYHDVHCWVFTPESFVELMGQLARCGLLGFECEWLVTTAPHTFEFFVSMQPSDDRARIIKSWHAATPT